MPGSYKHGNKTVGFTTCNEFLDELQNYHLLKDTVTWSYLLLAQVDRKEDTDEVLSSSTPTSRILPNTTFTSIPLASSGLGLCKLYVSYVTFKSRTYSFSVSTSSVITFCRCSAFFLLDKTSYNLSIKGRQAGKLYS